MKKYLLYAFSFLALAACVEETEPEKTYTSVLEPEFTIVHEGEKVIEGDIVSFTNESKVEGTEVEHWFWHFGFEGNGNWQDAETPEPVQYRNPGEYTVTLTIKGKDGNSVSATRQLIVSKKNVAPKADFTYAWEGNTIKLTDTSVDEDGAIASWNWTIVDGSVTETFTTQNPTFTFAGGGKKQISLTVADDEGVENSVSKIVFLIAPVTEFTVNWEVKVEEPTVNASVDGGSDQYYIGGLDDRQAVVTVAENESKVYFGTSRGNLYSITDNYFEATVTKVVEAGINQNLSSPAYSDGSVYWMHNGTMYAVNAATDQEMWQKSGFYDKTSTVRLCSPCVTPTRIVVAGANGPDGYTHLRAYAKDGSDALGVNAARGGAMGAVVMLKNGTGFASINRHCATWVRPNETTQIIDTGRLYDFNKRGTNYTQPCIDAKGRVYYMLNRTADENANKMLCVDFSTADKWGGHITDAEYKVWEVAWGEDDTMQYGGLTLNAEGTTLYLALKDKLYLINTSDGQKTQEVTLPGESISSPAVDNTGAVHVVTANGHYVVIGTDLTIKHDVTLASELAGSVTISNSGVCYVAGMKEDGWYVFAISLPGVTGPANSAWAQYGQNSGHTNYQK